jgi:hypothetical protein
MEGNTYALIPGVHHVDTVGAVQVGRRGAPQLDLSQAAGMSVIDEKQRY